MTTIIIPVFSKHIHRCVEAVEKHTKDYEIFFVTGDECKQNLDDKEGFIIYDDQPFVFSRRINLAINRSEMDYYVLLNDDVVVSEGWLDSLVMTDAEMGPGLVSSRVQSPGCHNRECWGDGPATYIKHQSINFFCTLIPKFTYEIVGPLDERFVGYGGEDEDYSYRCRQMGLPLLVSDVKVLHEYSSSFPTINMKEEVAKSQKIFRDKWGIEFPVWPKTWTNRVVS